MLKNVTWFVLAASALSALGCSGARKRSQPEVFTPQPRVTWGELCPQSIAPPDEGYALLGEPGSVGRFPATVGVTRLAVREKEGARVPVLPGRPKNEFLTWNRAFDELMAISNVFPVAQRDLGGGDARPMQILAAFRGLQAGLGIIYATNELSPTETEMIGVLYDSSTARPLAAISARAVSTAPADPDDIDELDPWKHDSRALVRKRFVEHCFNCVRELIALDKPERVDVPAGWIPAGPARPVQWPSAYLPAEP